MSDEPARPRYGELAAVLALGTAHVVIEITLRVGVSRVFNALALTACLGYLVWRMSTTKGILRAWGLRADNFWTALRAQLLFFIPAVTALLIVGLIRGNVPVPPSFWLVCGLYPFFGIAQEFVLQNLIVSNFRGLIRPFALCAFVSTMLFGLSHLPRTSLSALAFLAAFFFTLIHRRHPNIWAVGIAHGLLAAMVFYMFLGEDPGARILEQLSRLIGQGDAA